MTIISNEAGDTTASLAASVTQSVQKYFSELSGTEPVDLYQFVLEEIEPPLFRAVMEHCKYNQSRDPVPADSNAVFPSNSPAMRLTPNQSNTIKSSPKPQISTSNPRIF